MGFGVKPQDLPGGCKGAQVSPAGSVGAGRCPPGTSAPAFPYTKKGGRMSPYWDSTKAVAPGLEMGKRKGPDKTSGADGLMSTSVSELP